MYSEQDLANRIATITNYSVSLAEDTSIDLFRASEVLPRVYVGHLGIKLQHPQQMYADGYTELTNPEILLTSIQFICERLDLVTVRTNIKQAYQGYSPYPNDGNFSSLVFLEANMVSKTNTKVWWQEIIGLVMPRVT